MNHVGLYGGFIQNYQDALDVVQRRVDSDPRFRTLAQVPPAAALLKIHRRDVKNTHTDEKMDLKNIKNTHKCYSGFEKKTNMKKQKYKIYKNTVNDM